MGIGQRDNFRAVVYICMLPASLTHDSLYVKKQEAYQQLETGSHWPCREEWFAPRKASQACARPYFREPPKLSARQELLYGLVRYATQALPAAPSVVSAADNVGGGSVAAVAGESEAKQKQKRWGKSGKDEPGSQAISGGS